MTDRTDIKDRWVFCSTCKHNHDGAKKCLTCDSDYSEWELACREQILSLRACSLCQLFDTLTNTASCSPGLGICEFTLDEKLAKILLSGYIDINKHTIRGILE